MVLILKYEGHRMQINKKAFTLVEVLITIGIIGVVAALTIPTLIQNSNSKKFTTQFKKSLSTLNQAAIGAQAQYDMDFSSINKVSNAASCGTDSLSGGQYTLCGLLNNTLAGQTYAGVYGSVPGANNTTPYKVGFKTINPEGFLIYNLADGSLIGFNPQFESCGITAGTIIDSDLITSKNLTKCIGFIDVNGVNPPNSETTCASGDVELGANKVCEISGAPVLDVFPIIFHGGTVEPVTDAALAVFLGEGSGKAATGQQEQQTPKYDLSTPEGRKQADVDNMENIANAFKKAFIDNELPMANNIDSVQFTVYGKDNGGDTKLNINTKYPGGSVYDAIQSGLPEIIKNSGVDLDNIMVNSSDDKWKYGYTINYDRKTNKLSIWARGQNDNSSNSVYWYRQTDITESDRH